MGGWGVTNQITILGGGIDNFWNHTIPVYDNTKFSAILLDSKSNYWSLIMWYTFSLATCEDYFNQNVYDEKKQTNKQTKIKHNKYETMELTVKIYP